MQPFFSQIRLILVLTLSACALVNTACVRPKTPAETPVVSQPPSTNPPLPPVKTDNSDIGWTIANTQHMRMANMKNKILVLDFYATWCEPCRESIPHLIDLHKRYASKGVEIVGLNVGGADDYDKVPAFAREFRIPYQLGVPDPELEQLFMEDDGSIPQTFILDRQGHIVKHFIGYDESLNAELEGALLTLLGESR